MFEIWSPIKGTKNLYHVSNLGRVYSSITDTIIYQHTGTGGYKGVLLHFGGRVKKVLVHRLVAAAFCIKHRGCKYVNHIDHINTNNTWLNLEWVTQSENMKARYKNEMRRKKVAESLPGLF